MLVRSREFLRDSGADGWVSRDWLRSAAVGLSGTGSLGTGSGATCAGVTRRLVGGAGVSRRLVEVRLHVHSANR